MGQSNTRKRHLAKSITWRIVGSVDTMVMAWIISGNPLVGLKVSFWDFTTKILLYYLHERVWFRFNLSNNTLLVDSRKRHMLKAVTWRVVGTVDTMALTWIISGNPLMGIKVGFAEVFSKLLLYYVHERIWHRFDFGLKSKTIGHNE